MAEKTTATAPTPRSRGLAGKRRAIIDGALRLFARDGYTRTSIEAIAAVSGVSTRTIYNHFGDKADLFETAIQESAARVAEAHIALIDRHLRKVADVEADLIDFGRDWARPLPIEHDHFALVRQINADAGHIPKSAIEAWQKTGPSRVRRELASRLRELADRGLLRIDDSERAAGHLLRLIAPGNPSYRAAAATDEEIDEAVTAGVRAFLHGYIA
jgi:AcrR family transcriptional regulator